MTIEETLRLLVREEVAAALDARMPKVEPPTALYLRARAYAERIAVSERTVWSMIARGLPTIGEGRSRRVDVMAADGWLRQQPGKVDDAVERSARQSARRAANARRSA